MIEQGAKTLCIYGATGTYKTTSIGRFARYIHKITNKRTRLVTAEAGNLEPIQDEIDEGIIEVATLVDHPALLSILRGISKLHMWPTEVNGKLKLVREHELDQIGAYAIEGITTISELLLRHLANSGRKINEDVVGQFSETDAGLGLTGDDFKFAAPARSHYGFVQKDILDIIQGFSSLPINRVLFTAHEGKGQDEFSKQLVYGPGSVGKAATGAIPSYVGDLIHYEIEDGGMGKDSKVVAYLKSHADAQTKVLWPAKIRLRAKYIPEFQKAFPGGKFELTVDQGIERYLAFQDEIGRDK